MARNSGKITIHDIARVAKVSASTVSRSFDSANKHRISEKTRKHVYKVADKYGYQPNKIARALSRGGTDTIALVLPDVEHSSDSEYCTRVIMRTVAVLGNLNFDLKIHTLHNDESNCNLSDLLAKFTVDGLIITGFTTQMHFKGSNNNESLPVAILNGYEIPSATRIDADNIAGGRLAADYFINSNHVNLGMLSGPEYCCNARDRENGYRTRLKEAGLKLHEEWFISSDYGEPSGYEGTIKLLKRPSKPTALFCANDELALGAMRAIRECGLKCPEDVSLIGFDNFSAAQHTTPPLTTIEQPINTMVDEAIDHLMKIINHKAPLKRVVFPIELVERESVLKL